MWLLTIATAALAGAPKQPTRQQRPRPAPAAANGAAPCFSCGEPLTSAKRVKHMSFCCPDLLDPDGWRTGDQVTVLAHVEAMHGLRSEEGRFLCLRFAGGDDGLGVSTRAAASRARWSLRRARSVVAGALHAMPPVAEPNAPLSILFEDRDMVVVAKPAGVAVTPRCPAIWFRWGGARVHIKSGRLD